MTSAAAGGFAKGFANGFVTTFNAAQQRNHETDQLTLKSRLDQLREDAEARKKKQEAEQESLSFGEKFATNVGAPDFASRAAELHRMGLSPEQIQSQWDEGRYRKKPVTDQEVEVKNSDLVTRPKTTMAMPTGVDLTKVDPNTALQPIPNTSEASVKTVDPKTALDPAITDEAKTRGMTPEQLQDSMANADQTIKDAGIQVDVPNSKVEQKMGQINDGWEYIPPTKKEKFPDLAEAYYQRTQAKQAGNMDEFHRLDSIVKSYSYAKGLDKISDPTVHQFAQLDEKGKFLTYFDGQIMEDPDTGMKRYYNLDTQKFQDGNIRYIPKDVYADTGKIIERFEGRSEKYNVRRAKFTASLEGASNMVDLVDKYEMPNTIVGRLTADMKGLVEEARTGLTVFEKEAMADIDNGDFDSVRERANALSEKARTMLSEGIKNEADAVILFETYKTALVYDLAAAKGETGQSLNKADIANFKSQLTAKDGPTLKKQMAAALSSVWRSLEAERVGLNMDASGEVTEQEKRLGFSLDYKKNRYENFLGELYQDNPEMLKKVTPIWQMIDKKLDNTAAVSTSPVDVPVTPVETKPIEIEVNGRKVITGKTYKSKSGQIGTFNANGEWVPQN